MSTSSNTTTNTTPLPVTRCPEWCTLPSDPMLGHSGLLDLATAAIRATQWLR